MCYEYYFTQGSLPSLFFTLITEIIYFLLNHSTFVYTNHSVLPWPTVTKINILTFPAVRFNQRRRVTTPHPLPLLHHTCRWHTIPRIIPSLLLTTFIGKHSQLSVSETLKNVSSLRGDLPHAPGNMSSISTPGVGQPIPLRRFLPPSWSTSQRRGHLDSYLRDSTSTTAISPNTRRTLWQCDRLFLYLSFSPANGIQPSVCQH